MAPQKNYTPPKPKEHGAWGMLYIPFLLSVGVTGQFTLAMLLLLGGVTLAFVSQRPLTLLLSRHPGPNSQASQYLWLGGYWLGAALLFATLILHYQLRQLFWFGLAGIPIAALFVFLVRRNAARTVGGELLGVVGLTMTAPMAHYVAVEQLQRLGLLLWGASILYFASSIFFVKSQVEWFVRSKSKEPSQSVSLGGISKAYHLALLALLINLVLLGYLPSLALVAFLPITVRAFWSQSKVGSRPNFTRVGWLEVAYSLFFAVMMIWALRSAALDDIWLEWLAKCPLCPKP